MRFLIEKNDRPPAACVASGAAGVVLLAASFEVRGDARIERAVATAEDVEEPGHPCTSGGARRLQVTDATRARSTDPNSPPCCRRGARATRWRPPMTRRPSPAQPWLA